MMSYLKTLQQLSMEESPVFRKRKDGFHLHSVITSCGHSRISAGENYHYDGRSRGNNRFYSYQLTVGGQGRLKQHEEWYALRPGTAFLLATPGDYIYEMDPNEDYWEFVFITLSGNEILRILDHTLLLLDPIHPITDNSPIIPILIDTFCTIHNPDLNLSLDLSICAYRFALTLLSEVRRSGSERRIPRLVLQAEHYMKTNFHRNIGIANVAESIGTSTTHISRLFRRCRDSTLHEYLEDLRLKKAIELLFQGKLSVARVAKDSGFQSSSYFCKVFKKHIGLTPLAYRHSHY